MKQNERLLVYAVTAFLALILVIAVVFGDDGARAREEGAQGGTTLNDILNGGADEAAADEAGVAVEADAEKAGANAVVPVAAVVEQPLRAQAPSASVLVAQRIGVSRREQDFRWVTAKANDGWEMLVQRWCGKVKPYLDETRKLNETTTMLREGQNVLVPWVDDEVLLALWEADQRPVLVSGGDAQPASGAVATGSPAPAGTTGLRTPTLSPTSGPAAAGAPADPGELALGAVVSFEVYEVKSGDTLWPLLAKRFGNGKVPGMIKKVVQLNPGLDPDRLRVGRSIKLPLKSE